MSRIATAFKVLTGSVPRPAQPVSPWQTPDALTSHTLSDLFGLTGTHVTRESAISLGPVKRGRKLITSQIASLPLIVYKGTDRVTPQPAFTAQLELGRARSVTIAWIVDALLFYGRAYLEVTNRDWTNRPTRFAFVPEWNAKTDGAGNLLAIGDRHVTTDQWIRIDSDEEGILATAQADINELLAIKQASRRASDNPVPSIELHQTGGDPLTDAQVDRLIERWAAARRGENGGVAFTNQSLEAKVHGVAAEQLLISARNQSSIDVVNHMNLPAWSIDAVVEGSSMNYTNVPSRTRELIDYTLKPYMLAITERLSMDDVLPAGTWCQFDTSHALQGSFTERMTGYKAAIDSNIYTADECRALERGLPLEERKTP